MVLTARLIKSSPNDCRLAHLKLKSVCLKNSVRTGYGSEYTEGRGLTPYPLPKYRLLCCQAECDSLPGFDLGMRKHAHPTPDRAALEFGTAIWD